jgi:hypothetical protein
MWHRAVDDGMRDQRRADPFSPVGALSRSAAADWQLMRLLLACLHGTAAAPCLDCPDARRLAPPSPLTMVPAWPYVVPLAPVPAPSSSTRKLLQVLKSVAVGVAGGPPLRASAAPVDQGSAGAWAWGGDGLERGNLKLVVALLLNETRPHLPKGRAPRGPGGRTAWARSLGGLLWWETGENQ